MRRKSLTILASLFFAFAVVFVFESPPAKANTYDGKSAISAAEGVGNPLPVIVDIGIKPGLHIGYDFTPIGYSQSVYASAGTVAVTQSPHDMINGGARNLYYLNDFRAGHLDGDDPCLYKNLFAYERKNLVALPSRPVLLA